MNVSLINPSALRLRKSCVFVHGEVAEEQGVDVKEGVVREDDRAIGSATGTKSLQNSNTRTWYIARRGVLRDDDWRRRS